MWQKKRVWQVTTIIQLALCHLVTSHFQEIACNYTPKGQIRWPIFLLLLCMIVLTEITSKFPKPIIFRILVFSCHKMTLITIITRMPLTCIFSGPGPLQELSTCLSLAFAFPQVVSPVAFCQEQLSKYPSSNSWPMLPGRLSWALTDSSAAKGGYVTYIF